MLRKSDHPVVSVKRVVSLVVASCQQYRFVIPAALVTEAALLSLIIVFVAYTEIDWSTYRQFVRLFLAGERDYYRFVGDTGPLVYPAGFLYLYTAIGWLVGDGPGSLHATQWVFAVVYLLTLAIVLAIYRKARLPTWTSALLVCSKRIHSIYVLRLFNDCLAMLLVYVAIYLLIHRRHATAILVLASALSTKMNVLLFWPAFALVLLRQGGWRTTAKLHLNTLLLHLFLGLPFLTVNWKAYLHRSFDFGRQFIYFWSVNWKFIPESTFATKSWSVLLVCLHASLLLIWAHCRWLRPEGGIFGFLRRISSGQSVAPWTSQQTIMAIFECNLIGIVMARSLHYQFYLWYFHTIPALLFATNLPPFIRLFLFAMLESSWNTFPSTPSSSLILFLSNLVLLFASLFNRPAFYYRTPTYHRHPRQKHLSSRPHYNKTT